MTPDIETLRQALAAGPTPGPWQQEPHGGHLVWFGDGDCLADADQPGTAALIAAASPDRIGRLLDALEAAQLEVAAWRLKMSAAMKDQPVAQIERDGVVWIDTNPYRLPIGTKLYAGACPTAMKEHP